MSGDGDFSTPSREPDFHFEGDLFASGHLLFPCDGTLWLPRNAREVGAIDLGTMERTDWGHAQAMNNGETVELRAIALGRGTEIFATGVWADSGPLRFANEGRVRRARIFISDIDHLKLTDRFPEEPTTDHPDRLQVCLTDTAYLMLGGTQTQYPTGEVKVRQLPPVECAHPVLGNLLFERHHVHARANEDGDRLTTSQVRLSIAAIGGRCPDLEEQSVLAELDDVCLLLSFAARHRVSLRGWERARANTFEQVFVSPLRSLNVTQDARERLIDRRSAMRFLSHAYAVFAALSAGQREAVRQALYPLVPTSTHVLEQSFLSMFAAFESLVAVAPKCPAGLASGTWKKVESALRKAIDEVDAGESALDRLALKGRLAELKRPPARERVEHFLNHHNVDTADLWPVFGLSSDGMTLYGLRNALAHGMPLSSACFPALCGARLHLRTLLERSVLAVLGWTETSGADRDEMRRAGYVGYEGFGKLRGLLPRDS